MDAFLNGVHKLYLILILLFIRHQLEVANPKMLKVKTFLGCFSLEAGGLNKK